MSLILKSILLGILQGITEFLPVSSSGHLAVVEYALKKNGAEIFPPEFEMFFNVAMHFASLLAILLFFRGRIVDIFKAGNRRVLALIIVGSIPAGIVGVALENMGTMDALNEMPVVIGLCFLITAALLKLTDYAAEAGFELRKAGWGKALLVGAGQALGILPGVSRSGATISTGLVAGLKREDAVVYSFFLAIPAILGAACLKLLGLVNLLKETPEKAPDFGVVLAGFIAAFVTSLIAIKLILVIVRLRKFSLFMYYCLLAAAATFVIAFIYR